MVTSRYFLILLFTSLMIPAHAMEYQTPEGNYSADLRSAEIIIDTIKHQLLAHISQQQINPQDFQQKLAQLDIDAIFATPSENNPIGGKGYRMLKPAGEILGKNMGSSFATAVGEQMKLGVHHAIHHARNQAYIHEFFAHPCKRFPHGGQGYQMLKPVCVIMGQEFGAALSGEMGQKLVAAISAEIYRQMREGGSLIVSLRIALNNIGEIMRHHGLRFAGGAIGLAVVGYGAMQAIKLVQEKISKIMNAPQLMQQESMPDQLVKTISDLRYPASCKEKISDLIQETKICAESDGRLPFRNLLLYGKPGTGKTELAEVIAKEAGMLFVKTTGGDFGKLQGKDLGQIDSLFSYLRSKKRPVLLFIDEIENLFASRSQNLAYNQSNILTKLLGLVNAMDTQIMIVGATNIPEYIDAAVIGRRFMTIEIALPDFAARKEIIELYLKKLFLDDKKFSDVDLFQIHSVFTSEMIEHMAAYTQNFSGADIELLMTAIKTKMQVSGELTEALVDAVIRDSKKNTTLSPANIKKPCAL